MTTTASARTTVERLLRAAISPTPGDMADCYADEVVIDMPFTGGVTSTRLETTREQLRARFAAGAARLRFTAVNDLRVHETTDPDVVVVEYRLDGTTTVDQTPVSLPYVMVMSLRDGLIVASRDYTDPLAGARALGRLSELVASLGPEADPATA